MLTTPLANRNARYLPNSSTNAAFILGTAGTIGFQRLIGTTLTTVPDGSFYALNGALSAIIKFFGQVSADNATATVNVWLGNYLQPQEKANTQFELRQNIQGGVDLWYAGQVGLTYSTTMVPPSGDLYIAATAKLPTGTAAGTVCYADGVTWAPSTAATTPKGPMSAFEGGFTDGSSFAFSPADNAAIGFLALPCLCRQNVIVLDFKTGTNCVACNAVIETARP